MLIRADYKKEINNSDWMNEKISEVFDDATEMMSENSIVYGGAIRDALAGMELSGDIDIAVDHREYDGMIAKFRSNVKWISKNNLRVDRKSGSKSDYRMWLPKLLGLSSFVHVNGNIAQVIAINTKDVCSIVRDVDIVCCAVIMTCDGRVFEVVEGAHEDCVAKVLRLNKTKNIINISETPERIRKLTNRGWRSLITDKQIERAVNRRIKTVAAKPQLKIGIPVRKNKLSNKYELKVNSKQDDFVYITDKHSGSWAIPENMIDGTIETSGGWNVAPGYISQQLTSDNDKVPFTTTPYTVGGVIPVSNSPVNAPIDVNDNNTVSVDNNNTIQPVAEQSMLPGDTYDSYVSYVDTTIALKNKNDNTVITDDMTTIPPPPSYGYMEDKLATLKKEIAESMLSTDLTSRFLGTPIEPGSELKFKELNERYKDMISSKMSLSHKNRKRLKKIEPY